MVGEIPENVSGEKYFHSPIDTSHAPEFDVSDWTMQRAREVLGTEYDHPVEVDGKIMNVNIRGSGERFVVMLAGRGVTSPTEDLAPLRDQLVGDHTVLTVEYFGSGLSDMSNEPLTPQRYADHVAEALERLGIGRYALVAHSIGGIYGLNLVYDHPDKVTAVVGIDTAVPRMEEVMRSETPELLEQPSEAESHEPWTLADEVGDVVGYEFTVEEKARLVALHKLNYGNDAIYQSMKVSRGEGERRVYDFMQYPETTPVKFALSSESSSMAPWYIREHEKQRPGSSVVLMGSHFLHHTQAAAIAEMVRAAEREAELVQR